MEREIFSMKNHRAAKRHGIYVPLPHSFICSEDWRGLSQSAKAVYIVIAVHKNGKHRCQIGLDTIAAMTGVCKKTAWKAIKELESEGLLTVFRFYNSELKRNDTNIYVLESEHLSVQEWHFKFPKTLVTSGIWTVLSLKAKAVFLTLVVNLEPLYGEICGGDEVTMKVADVVELTGISRKTVSVAIDQLTHKNRKGHSLFDCVGRTREGNIYRYRGNDLWVWKMSVLNDRRKSERLREKHYGR
ncbi:MAG: helix-turn-helix domain-containing protein [bacterium]